MIALIPTLSGAQSSLPNPKWELEVHLGGLIAGSPPGGTLTLPPAGDVFSTVTGSPSRRVPSWFFGEGPVFLNDANAALGTSTRTALSLDSLLGAPLARQKGGRGFGFRVARSITSRLSVEAAFHQGTGLRMVPAATGVIRDAGANVSFAIRDMIMRHQRLEPAATLLFLATPLTEFVSQGTARGGTGTSRHLTATADVALKGSGNAIPYVTGGMGVRKRSGDLPSATLQVAYHVIRTEFDPAGETVTEHADIREREDLAVRMSAPSRQTVGVFGGGIKFQPRVRVFRGRSENTSRWGIRVDIRMYISGSKSETFLSGTSSVGEAATTGSDLDRVIVVGRSPVVQFSNNPAGIGPQSSLAHTTFTDIKVFEGKGIEKHVDVTTGIFLRF